jgi:hypothetical protein
MDMQGLPEAPESPTPPAPPAPKKHTGWKIIGAVILGLLVLGVAQDLTKTQEAVPIVSPIPVPSAAVPPVLESCIEADQAMALSQDASDSFTAAGAAAAEGDVVQTSLMTRTAASDFHQIATLAAADPEISRLSEEAANHLDAAADAIDAGEWNAAAQELDLATALINDATAAIGVSDVPAC